jgi:hypothetical protein
MKAILVCSGIYGNSLDAHFPAGSYYTKGYFSPVCNQYLIETLFGIFGHANNLNE